MKNKTIIGMLIASAILIVIGTLYDEQIAVAAYGQAHLFAKFMEIFGEAPFFVGLVGVFAFFARMADFSTIKGKIVKIVDTIFGAFFSFGYGLVLMSYARSEFGGSSNAAVGGIDYVIAVIIGVALFGGIYYFFNRIERANLERHRKTAWLIVALLVVEIVGVQLIKTLWGRPRFWSVSNGDASFVPWYIISGPAKSNMYKSFISGHTANAMMMIALYLFPKPENQSLRNKLLVFGLVWGALVGLSRVFLGQHYLTDVTFGGVFTIIAFFGLKKLLKVK